MSIDGTWCETSTLARKRFVTWRISMKGRRSLIAATLAVVLAFTAVPTLTPVAAQTPTPTQSLIVPVTQTLAGIGTFTGQVAVSSFKIVNGQLAAVGTLTGRITDTAGNLLGTVATAVTLPVSNLSGSCSILHLELGPLDLNLLGLQIHLDKVVLDISAQSGSGNLLGNLLCAIANVLNGGGPLSQLVTLLNQLLAAL
jgi:hypothetical protein